MASRDIAENELRNLLSERQGEGEIHSVGAFTVDVNAAKRKVARFGLGGREAALLNLVQLGVAAGASEITITLGARDVGFFFESVEGEDFRMCSLSDPLVLALTACFHSGFESGKISDFRNSWTVSAETFQRCQAKPKRSTRRGVQIELMRPVVSGFWGRLRADLKGRWLDHTSLCKALIYSPVPLKVDGLMVQSLQPVSQSWALSLLLTGPERLLPDAVGWFLGPEKRPTHLWERGKRHRLHGAVETHETFLQIVREADSQHYAPAHPAWAEPIGHQTVLASLWLTMTGQTRGTLTFVRHGVIVGSCRWPGNQPVNGVVSAVGLDTDLSGQSLVHNQKLENLLYDLMLQFLTQSTIVLEHSPPPDVHCRLRETIAEDER